MLSVLRKGFLWLADLSVLQGLPVARGFIPAGLQSSPKTCHHSFYMPTACQQVATASQPSGDSLWRGDSSPLGCKAAPKPATTVSTGTPRVRKLRLLRSRAGINPLTTRMLCTSRDVVCVRKGFPVASRFISHAGTPCGEGIHPRWAAKQPQNLPPQFLQAHRV
jgi:hypothetical protein